jgi:alpha-tubulin suppressor-like RCC1 family protein
LKEFHKNEKNYKVKKLFEMYAWGNGSDFLLGYPVLNKDSEAKLPRRVQFEKPESHAQCPLTTSIATIKSSEQFALAVSEDGDAVYAWGRGTNGHLGNGSEAE